MGKPDNYHRKIDAINNHLAPYGMNDADKLYQNESGYFIYNNRDSTNIMRVDEIKAEDGTTSYVVRDDAPGKYVTYNLDKLTDEAIKNCKKLETEDEKHPHTKEYLDLFAALKGLRSIKLNDQPDLAQVTEASARFDSVKKSLEKFTEAKMLHPGRVESQNDYDDALKKLTNFAKSKLIGLNWIAQHIATKERIALQAEEIGSAVQAAQSEPAVENACLSAPEDYMNFAMEWHNKMAQIQENFAERSSAAPKFQIWNEEINGDIQEKLVTDNDKAKVYSEISGIFNALADPVDMLDKQDSPKMKAMLGEDLFQAGVAGNLKPEELADVMAKNVLACGVVTELLNLESKMPGKNTPIKDLVRDGKLNQVVDMVKRSQLFGSEYRSLDLSDATEAQLKNILNGKAAITDGIPHPKEIAQDIMKSYLAHQNKASQNAKAPVKNVAPEKHPQQKIF
jgi:hypothetical protein